MQDLRGAIEGQIRALMGSGSEARRIPVAGGDAGLFGPDSAYWRVHGDFTSMMVGGVAALLTQMLHPGALAGVWDHSNFRDDMMGRLRRTAGLLPGPPMALRRTPRPPSPRCGACIAGCAG